MLIASQNFHCINIQLLENIMPIPSYEKILLPLLILIENGKTYSFDDVLPILAKEFGLTQKELEEVVPSGVPKFLNHIQWARSHLKQALLLENPGRGFFRITQRGIEELNKKPLIIDKKYLMQFPEYVEFLNKKKSNKKDPKSTASQAPRMQEGSISNGESLNRDRSIKKEENHFSVDNILASGSFLEYEKISSLLHQWKIQKNLILQGPPGTGKTWLAKKLAYALIGRMDDSKVRPVQFHPNFSYEDFVRGWRPTGEGTLSMVDGVFMNCIISALNDPESTYVVVIEEINRGNPAQIFGEMLTLLEADKRNPSAALELCYPDPDGQHRPVYIPENLFVIGTMNLADRSLALVDLALRRRFMFFDLEPNLNDAWINWVVKERGVDLNLANTIKARIETLNDIIALDPRLGKQFLIGHSFVTPAFRLEPSETQAWFRQVVNTQISPLLYEYWFDSQSDAENACKSLLNGW